MANRPQMRSIDEVQRAHDLIVSVLTGTKDLRLRIVNTEKVNLMIAAVDALCWVLGHDHNATFATNLANLEYLLREEGIEMQEVQ
jgi:hypothetical protein